MSSTPRITLNGRERRMAGIVDPLPMFDPVFVHRVRDTIAIAFGATALDRGVWDMLRVKMAELVNCGVCRHMRDTREAPAPQAATASADKGTAALIALAERFHSVDPGQSKDVLPAAIEAWGEDAVAEALLGPIFGGFHAKVIVVCGLEPEDPSQLTSKNFDSSRYSREGGALDMLIPPDNEPI